MHISNVYMFIIYTNITLWIKNLLRKKRVGIIINTITGISYFFTRKNLFLLTYFSKIKTGCNMIDMDVNHRHLQNH